jgi:tetratricopeptide (TPR) repeat protein
MQDAPLLDDARPATFGKGLALELGAGLLLKGVYLTAVLANPVLRSYWVLDSKEYLALGSRFAANELGREVFSSSPLYIWLVAHICPDGVRGIALLLALQQLLGLATAAFVAVIGRQLFGVVAGLMGAALYLLYGAGAMLEVKLLPATLSVFLATLSLGLCIGSIDRPTTRRRAGVRGLAGAALGGAALCKPDLLLGVPLVVAGAWFFQRGPLRTNFVVAGVCVVGLCASILPATLHNLRAGELIPVSSQGGVTFYQGNNPRAEGTFSQPEGFTGNKATQQREATELAEHATGRELSHRQVDSYWYGRGLSFLKGNPDKALRLWCRKLMYWISSNELSSEYTLVAERDSTWAIWLFPFPFGLLLALGLTQLIVEKGGRWTAHEIALWSVVAISVVATLLFYCSSRYRLIAVSPLAVLGGKTLSVMWQKRLRWSWILSRVVGLSVAVAITFIPARSAVTFQAASQWYLYGNEAFRRRDYRPAIVFYERALETRRRSPNIEFNLAQAYAQTGEFKRAAQHMDQVLSMTPDDKVARELSVQYDRRGE